MIDALVGPNPLVSLIHLPIPTHPSSHLPFPNPSCTLNETSQCTRVAHSTLVPPGVMTGHTLYETRAQH